MKMLLSIQKIGDVLERIVKFLVIFSLGLIAFLVNLTVFYRYVLKSPLSWSTELPELLLVFTVLFAAAPAIRHDLFVRVEAFSNLMPKWLEKLCSAVSKVGIGAFLAVCIVTPEELIQKAVLTGTVSPALGIPMGLMYLLIRSGFIVVFVFLLLSLVDSRIRKSKGESAREGARI